MSQINIKMPSIQVKDSKNESREDLKLLAAGLNIPVLVEIEEVKTKGWQGSAKGLLQILWD